MIEHRLDTQNAILHLKPTSALEREDFTQLAKSVDPYLEKSGDLAGLIVEVDAFPGWDSLGEAKEYSALPATARAYVEKLEEWIGVPIRLVSVGSHRGESLWR